MIILYTQDKDIGGKEVISVGDFLKKLIAHAKIPIICEPDTNLFRPVDTTKQIPDTTKFDTLTGWQPKYTLEESIEWLLNTYRDEIKKTQRTN